MDLTTPQKEFFEHDGAPIAVRARRGQKSPGFVWLSGYRSDMLGSKAEKIDEIAALHGHACLRFDYSGHGESGGDFFDGSISRWLSESLKAFELYCEGPQILVGSSMGGWMALRMAQELAKKKITLAGMVLLAPAPDFTHDLIEPALTQNQKNDLQTKGFFEVPSPYAPEPTPFTRKLIEDGRQNLVMQGLIDPACPIHIIQGMQDDDVPYQHTLELMQHLPFNDVTLSLIRDGDHRLSRPQDLAFLEKAISLLLEKTR